MSTTTAARTIRLDSTEVETLILLKHGIFTFGADSRESYERMIDMATRNYTGDLPNELFAARGRTRGWQPSPAYIGLGFQLRGEEMSRHIFGTLTSPRTFGNQGAGSTLYWVDPELGMSFVCLTVRVLEDGDNIERFQRLSDIAVSAAT